jgi:hypothetical protein
VAFEELPRPRLGLGEKQRARHAPKLPTHSVGA